MLNNEVFSRYYERPASNASKDDPAGISFPAQAHAIHAASGGTIARVGEREAGGPVPPRGQIR
jgi:hypothetical protein